MNITRDSNIVFIGAGNLATHLSQAMVKAGYSISQVYSRTLRSAQLLAEKLNSSYTCDVKDIDENADLYILAIKDKALLPVLDVLKTNGGAMLHTAGSVALDVFKPYAKFYGVFYPLQTFSKEREVDFLQIPICIEANDEKLKNQLLKLGGEISSKVYEVNSLQRKQLHLSAVFVCNFTNHMYSIGFELLKDKDLDFDMLRPLIMETAAKVGEMEPMKAQTGPAIRFDQQIIKNQEMQLEYCPVFQNLYRFVSESIYKLHASREEMDI